MHPLEAQASPSANGHIQLPEWVRARAAFAEREEAAAQASLNRAARIHRFWRGLAEDVAGGRVVSALTDCLRIRGREASDFSVDDIHHIAEMVDWLRPQVHQAVEDLPRSLPAELAARGLLLDAVARHPKYTLENGFFAIEIKHGKPIATISVRDGSPRRVPADATLVAEITASTRDRLFNRADRWVDAARLAGAYRTVVRARGLTPGDDVPLIAIRDALKAGRSRVPGDEFNVDLSQTLADAARAGKVRFVVSNTRDTTKGLLLYGMEQSGYLGYLHVDGVAR